MQSRTRIITSFINDKKKIFQKRVELFVDGDVSDNEFILVPEALLLVRLKTLGTFYRIMVDKFKLTVDKLFHQ